jgi:hypothetical protein
MARGSLDRTEGGLQMPTPTDRTRRSTTDRRQVEMTTTHRITTAAVILSLAAAGAPTATATANQPPASVYSRPDKEMIPLATPGSAPQVVVRIQTPPSGFDLGDAGIGAAGGLALAMIGVGGAVAVSQRGRRRGTTLPS